MLLEVWSLELFVLEMEGLVSFTCLMVDVL
jgi:hypothetical protein